MAHSMTFLGFVVSSSLHYCVSEKLQSQRDVQRLIYAVEDRALDGRIYTCFRMYTSSSHHMDRFVDQFSCKNYTMNYSMKLVIIVTYLGCIFKKLSSVGPL